MYQSESKSTSSLEHLADVYALDRARQNVALMSSMKLVLLLAPLLVSFMAAFLGVLRNNDEVLIGIPDVCLDLEWCKGEMTKVEENLLKIAVLLGSWTVIEQTLCIGAIHATGRVATVAAAKCVMFRWKSVQVLLVVSEFLLAVYFFYKKASNDKECVEWLGVSCVYGSEFFFACGLTRMHTIGTGTQYMGELDLVSERFENVHVFSVLKAGSLKE